MPWSFIIPAAASLIGGSMQSSAAKSAADTSAAASNRAIDLQREMFQKQNELQEPFRQAGLTGQNRLMELLGIGGQAGAQGYGSAAQPFGMAQFQQDPGYAFRLAEGQKALDRQAAARGGLISGAALKGAQQYGQGLGSQEYQNAFNRYQSERTAQLNPLQSLAGVGQSASNTLGSQAGQFGTNVGNIYQQQGVNQGNAMLAGAQARGSAYQGIGQLYGRTQPNFNSLGNMFGGGMPENPGFAGIGAQPY